MNLLKLLCGLLISISICFTESDVKTNTNIETYNVLSFSGGGSFGAVEIGILSKLIDDKLISTKYDLYTGISAGGLNAGFLSHFDTIESGLIPIQHIYSNLSNREIYKLKPLTGLSLLNTEPLKNTITSILSGLKSISSKYRPTIIGTTNLNTGYLDTYYYNQLELNDQIQLLMCTSAIPLVFPPITFKSQLYVDGGEIQNQLLDPITGLTDKFINITYITPYDTIQSNYNITTFEDIIKRNIQVVRNSFNNELYRLNQNCNIKRGIIYMYYVDPITLTDYSMLDFDKGNDLLKIGYNNIKHKIFNLC